MESGGPTWQVCNVSDGGCNWVGTYMRCIKVSAQ